MSTPLRARNAPEQYDDLAGSWWDERGPFAALHWLAAARGKLLPPPARRGALLVDLGCGGGLLAPHVPAGYRHVGVDRSASALAVAAAHGVETLQASVEAVPLDAGVADVVVAGELFEHVEDLGACVAEAARLLAPGGLLVFDTINATLTARVTLVWIGERLPGGPPRNIHDPRLFVDPERLRGLLAGHGVGQMELFGLQPHALRYARFVVDRATPVHMVRRRSLAGLYQGTARKAVA